MRAVLLFILAGLLSVPMVSAVPAKAPARPRLTDEELMDLVQGRTFKFFRDHAHPRCGLARERSGSGDLVTSGGSEGLWGEYAIKDAFNPSEKWIADGYLAIDQGPIVVMIENHRSGSLWNSFMKDRDIRRMFEKLDLKLTDQP